MDGVRTTKTGARRLLGSGESLVASTGLAVAAILLLAMAGAGWWALTTQRETVREARSELAAAWGSLLADQAGRLIDQGELSTLRSAIGQAAAERGLAGCSVVLADGQVIADADPAKITSMAMPAAVGPGRVIPDDPRAGYETRRFPVATRSGAEITVIITTRVPSRLWALWKMQAGIGAVGVAAMLGVLFVYRRMRARLRGIGAVREALLEFGAGEKSLAVLRVSPDLGPEAAAWSQLLDSRQQVESDLASERARAAVGNRRDVKGDLIQACDAMWQGLVLLDTDLRAQYANGAAAVFLRTKREQIAGKPVTDLVSDPRVLEAVRAVSAGSVRTRSIVEVKRDEAHGGGVLKFSIRPVRREDSATALVMIEDVTQQRVADEARNSFVAQATHELRTPLTNIRLYVEQAVDEGEADPALRARALNVINQESRRLERIVGDMLSVSEIEAGSLKLRAGDVRLEALFRDLETDFGAGAAEKKIDLTFELPPKFPVFQGDRDKIVLALHNLIGNAVKYTPEGGKVRVRVEAGGDSVSVSVTDTGIGISDEEAELVFERFYRSTDGRVSKITGSGLGLALAREVVRMHGGDITLTSKLNQGSTFKATFPVRAMAA
ncbi:MAG: PAS domain-containing protein [Phycisphaerales bacterium]|nr:PAS domain-containing protein [Phycisphaerales bacterium]